MISGATKARVSRALAHLTLIVAALGTGLRAHAEGPATLALADGAAEEDAPATSRVPAVGLPPALHRRATLPDERWTLPTAVVEAARAAATRPLAERMEAVSRPLLGLPYLKDASGEGDADDGDPPASYDRFDCLTFVEEMVGLAAAPDPLGAARLRDALRYRDGSRSYAARRHFMEASWVPDALANGLLVDVTERIGHARVLEKTVTSETWRGWRHRGLFHVPDALLPVGTWSLPYLDLAEAQRVLADIPAGSILLTLRMPRAGIPYAVTHVSTVVTDGTHITMRHASRMGAQRVRDDDLAWYLRHLGEYPRWPAIGVTVLVPREVGPRVSALASTPAWTRPVLPRADALAATTNTRRGARSSLPRVVGTARARDAAPSGTPLRASVAATRAHDVAPASRGVPPHLAAPGTP